MSTEVMYVVFVIAGCVAGFAIAWFMQSGKVTPLTVLLQQKDAELLQLKNIHDQLLAEKEKYQNGYTKAQALFEQAQHTVQQLTADANEKLAMLSKSNEDKATLYAQLKHTREKLDNQQNDMLRMREQLRLEFNELAQKILDDNSKKFADSNEQRIKQILEPLKLNISEFKQKVEETYDKESKERFSLGREVQRLIEMSAQVSHEANNLTTALKGSNKLQGTWGEMILDSLLENSGLTKGREYFVQDFIKDASGAVVRDENGKALQPDVMIYYPDGRKIIIDSKVSLVAWEQCIGCTDNVQQSQFLLDHIRSIRQHIDGLSRKNYPKFAQALDYVLLFIPIEPAFLEAVKKDTNLWRFAYERKILLVSPTNLFAVLKIVSDLWKVEQQNANAIAIAEKAGMLYDKFVGFAENMEVVGKKLEDATNSYTDAFRQLSAGRGNIINRVQELKKMGAAASKQIPERLLKDGGDDQQTI